MTTTKGSSPTVVTPLAGRPLKPGVKWLPVQKEQASGVAARGLADPKERELLTHSSAEILGSGVDPQKGNATATGLVVGYVQSGKTLSFTTVIGFARDNGFPLVILIAGNKDSLLTQSHQRLARDLDVEGGEGLPAWIMEKNPREQAQYEQLIKQTIANWRDKTRDADEKPTLLLTVLKQNHRLASLTALLAKIDLNGVPALVIDDEADQASLNTKVNQGQESRTYERIRDLRNTLPCHTFLQYTATPQAPLLINIADTLSPDFVHVLEPGNGYVGGAEFFRPRSPYVRVIPAADIPPKNSPLPVDPPPSLLEAMKIFFVGLAASIIGGKGRRSMLVHPARERVIHQGSAQWASAAKDEWNVVLGEPESDPDRVALVAEFRAAYDNLAKTERALPAFDAVIEKLPRALRNTTVIEFNTRGQPKTPEIKWRHAEGWILVGGQAVDRGFTVDSLSVTYMPRSVGVGNADTLQQRARFFGYKRRYLGICRIYLEQVLKTGFEDYVEHEEIMRRELKRLADTGESVRSWRRRFVLEPQLHPCRRSVISDVYFRGRRGVPAWIQQRGALLTADLRTANSAAIADLLRKYQFTLDTSYAATEDSQRHFVAHDVAMKDLVDALLEYRFEDPLDTASFTGILIALGEALRRDSTLSAAVYQMRPKAAVGHRTLSSEGTLEKGFLQGETALAGGGRSYPGDAYFRAPDRLTLQVHRFDLRLNKATVATAAPLVAVFIPAALAKSWLVQVQSGQ